MIQISTTTPQQKKRKPRSRLTVCTTNDRSPLPSTLLNIFPSGIAIPPLELNVRVRVLVLDGNPLLPRNPVGAVGATTSLVEGEEDNTDAAGGGVTRLTSTEGTVPKRTSLLILTFSPSPEGFMECVWSLMQRRRGASVRTRMRCFIRAGRMLRRRVRTGDENTALSFGPSKLALKIVHEA